MSGQSEISLIDGGRIVGTITEFDDNAYYVEQVTRIHRGRRLFKFHPSGTTAVPHEVIVAVMPSD
ncbi:hypothetical protein [Aeromicrobium sp. Root495]|uniref:hypothetical protein n=1 Tax=Aeromicrobium sp. Root495 TaxID=1736550 RepID=UPI000AA03549|nr:hypothetical protein [Aeromicrobium sp. Root495]